MAKIILNNKEFNIDDAVIASIKEGLKNHLLTTMAGEGATITLDGVTYNVDSTKLTTAKNDFVAHLGAIAGESAKIVVNGVEYDIDATKIAGAMSELGTAFGELENGGSGETLDITDENATLVSEDNEFGGQTAVIN
jgi:hypothetical protein